MWRLDDWVAIASQIAIAQIVRQYDDDVRSPIVGHDRRRQQNDKQHE
jgi:hypothetical protein